MNCNHPEKADGVMLCTGCLQTLSVALVNVAAFHTDVLRIQPGERVKVRSAYASREPSALAKPARDPISDAAAEVDNTIGTWCRALADDRPVGAIPKTTALRCGWLEGYRKTIATMEWAGELLRDVMAAERRLQRILDKADTGWYAGRCGAVLAPERVHDGETCICECHNGYACSDPDLCAPAVERLPEVVCPRGLYAVPGHGWIRCPECSTTHNTSDRREAMMKEAREHVAPVSVIAQVVVGLVDGEQSVERLANRIDQWVRREQLHDLGVRVLDGRPRRVYRVGDVLELVERGKRKADDDDEQAG